MRKEMTMSLYKCTDCGEVTDDVNMFTDAVISRCCDAPVIEVKRAHGDGCCCRDCDPSGLVQSYYARTGRVL